MRAGGRAARGATRRLSVTRASRVLVIHHGAPPAVLGPSGGGGRHEPRCETARSSSTSVDGTPLVLDPADELLFVCATGARTRACADVPVARRRVPLAPERRGSRPEARCSSGRAGFISSPTCARLCTTWRRSPTTRSCHDSSSAFDAEPVQRRDRVAFALAGVGGSRLAGHRPDARQLRAGHGRRPAASRGDRSAPPSAGALGSRSLAGVPVLALRKALRLGAVLRPAFGAGPEPLRVVLRLEAQLLRGVRDVPEAPGVGRDAVVDAVAAARAARVRAQPPGGAGRRGSASVAKWRGFFGRSSAFTVPIRRQTHDMPCSSA